MFNEPIIQHPTDHIMANTWRLILERKSEPFIAANYAQSISDYFLLEELLAEYRLIGLSLADVQAHHRYS